MNTKVNFYHGKFDGIIKKACLAASMAVGQQVRSDTWNLVPKRRSSGGLRDSCYVKPMSDGSAQVIWNTVYARFQYTHPAKHYTTPGTRDHWVEAAQTNRGALWAQTAQKAFAKEMT